MLFSCLCENKRKYLKNRVQLNVALLFSLLVSTRLQGERMTLQVEKANLPKNNGRQSITGSYKCPSWYCGVSVGMPQSLIVTKESTVIWIS